MCNVTANQRSTVKLSAVQSGVNCSMEEKVNVAVCDSRSSIYNIIVYNIIFVYIISRPTALCAPDGRSAGSSHRDWASRGLFTGVAMVSGLVCSNGLLGRPI